jgi:hypothetical protein
MSCIVLSDYHVSALVAWAVAHGVDLDTSPDAVAHMLAGANRAAFSDRYDGRYDDELVPFGGLDRSAGVTLDPVAIVKACDCLDYQASDWPRWNDSDAFGYLVAIRRAAVALADPDGNPSAIGRGLAGYDAAPWCLDEPEPEPEPVADLVTEARAVVATLQDMAVHPSHYSRLVDALANMSESDYLAIRSAMAVRGAV